MKALLKIVNIVSYGSKCINAISEGLKVCVANWPTDSPFNSSGNSNDQTNEESKQS